MSMRFECYASGSDGNAYTLDDGQTRILIECGLRYRVLQERLGWTAATCKGCLVTHEHMDHARAADRLIAMGAPVYMTAGTAEKLGVVGAHIVAPLVPFAIGTLVIKAFDVVHDAAQPVGYMIYSTVTREKLIFATDTNCLPVKVNTADYLALECNYCAASLELSDIHPTLKARIAESHMSLEEFLRLVSMNRIESRNDLDENPQVKTELAETNQASKLRRIYLLHLSKSRGDAPEFQRRIMAATGVETVVCGWDGDDTNVDRAARHN